MTANAMGVVLVIVIGLGILGVLHELGKANDR